MKSRSDKTKHDILLAAVLLFVAGAAAVCLLLFRQDGGYAVVVQDGVETARYPLSQEIEVTVWGEDGKSNILVIKDGMADIIDASCPDGLCVSQRSICYDGETIVCLPHKLVIKIESKEQGEVDVII